MGGAVYFGFGVIQDEVDFGPGLCDGGHDSIQVLWENKEEGVVVVGKVANTWVGGLEAGYGLGLGDAVDRAGEGVALVHACGCVDVFCTVGAVVVFAAWADVPMDRGRGGGRSCVHGGAVGGA